MEDNNQNPEGPIDGNDAINASIEYSQRIIAELLRNAVMLDAHLLAARRRIAELEAASRGGDGDDDVVQPVAPNEKDSLGYAG